MRLGRVRELSLDKARQMALDAVVEAKRGNDPSKARKAARRTAEAHKAKTVTLDAFLDEYVAVQAAAAVQSTPERVTAIRQHLKVFLGSPLQDLTRRELVTALDGVKKVYPAAAAKLRASIHHVFETAFDRGAVDANPLAGRRDPAWIEQGEEYRQSGTRERRTAPRRSRASLGCSGRSPG